MSILPLHSRLCPACHRAHLHKRDHSSSLFSLFSFSSSLHLSTTTVTIFLFLLRGPFTPEVEELAWDLFIQHNIIPPLVLLPLNTQKTLQTFTTKQEHLYTRWVLYILGSIATLGSPFNTISRLPNMDTTLSNSNHKRPPIFSIPFQRAAHCSGDIMKSVFRDDYYFVPNTSQRRALRKE